MRSGFRMARRGTLAAAAIVVLAGASIATSDTSSKTKLVKASGKIQGKPTGSIAITTVLKDGRPTKATNIKVSVTLNCLTGSVGVHTATLGPFKYKKADASNGYDYTLDETQFVGDDGWSIASNTDNGKIVEGGVHLSAPNPNDPEDYC